MPGRSALRQISGPECVCPHIPHTCVVRTGPEGRAGQLPCHAAAQRGTHREVSDGTRVGVTIMHMQELL